MATEIAPEDLPSIYRAMVVARALDERCLTMQRQGRIGFYVPVMGQEAAQVACAWALEAKDWIFPAYRELGLALVRGVTPEELLDQFFGNAADRLKGRQMPNHYGYRDRNFVSPSSPIGTQITQAVGAAMAARRRNDPIVTIPFFGDGATSSNDFHAGLNFAGVFRTPTIFFCQNNGWAISLPRSRQTAAKTLAEKGAAYGVPGVVVDGNDVHQVFRTVRGARARAIAGDGPTLIEAQVYRLGPHSTSDDPRRYRTDAELAEWKQRDPIGRLKHELVDAGQWSEERDSQLLEEVRADIAGAVQRSESVGAADPLSFLDDVYATRSPALEEQRQQLEGWIQTGLVKL
ncbi:MAG: thiamine pyrophosphate-dependent dehydrogenase E1 component subunit alpha [Thermoplasmata archaeon]|nr:thiamine pyrophosphate-dependent dehydrogenase E1 component subunit alpha [Thermoplasmata archaeon]